ncbi:MAG TPA: agmatinase [Phycisphaerae bacterium]
MASLPNNFLGLPKRFSDYARARFAILPIPYDATTSYMSGTRLGPAAIITASQQVELYDHELDAEFHKCGIATLEPLMPEYGDPRHMHELIYRTAQQCIVDGKFVFGLGGDHSVTSALVRAAAQQQRKSKIRGGLSILQIDAHTDLRDSYEGTLWSHAAVMRRCLDYADTLQAVGIRSVSLEEAQFMRAAGITPVFARDTFESDEWIDRVVNKLGEAVYVTIDIDGFDPAFAPGTGTPEPGGLDWYQVTSLLRIVAAEKRIVGADIVEVFPIGGEAVTEFLAARLAYRLICFIQAGEKGML